MSEIKPWPDKPITNDNCSKLDLMGALSVCNDIIQYERALVEAWEARCRVAVEALREIADNPGYDNAYSHEAKQSVDAIGPLPKEQRE
jgi:hypothetical protein